MWQFIQCSMLCLTQILSKLECDILQAELQYICVYDSLTDNFDGKQNHSEVNFEHGLLDMLYK